jgi:hypothetical protein
MSATVQKLTIVVTPDDDVDASWLEQDGYDDRLFAYRAGEFGFCGVRVEAVIHIIHPPARYGILQTITSPGIWGIEDDSGEEYIREVAQDEYVTLRDMLTELNVSLPPNRPIGGSIDYRRATR